MSAAAWGYVWMATAVFGFIVGWPDPSTESVTAAVVASNVWLAAHHVVTKLSEGVRDDG